MQEKHLRGSDPADAQDLQIPFKRLLEIAGLLSSTLDQQTVLRQATQAACEVVGADSSSLFLIDSATGQLFFEIAHGPAGEKIEKLRLQMGEGIVGHAIEEARTIISNTAQTDSRHSLRIDKSSGYRTRNLICCPLIIRGRTIGAIEALNKKDGKDFGEQDRIILETLSHQIAISIENSRLYKQQREAFQQTVLSLVVTIEKRDPYTGGHTQRVFSGSVEIAKRLAFDVNRIDRLRMGALLHDIGKIGISDSILRKRTGLDTDEWKIMKTHPSMGVEIFQHIFGLGEIVPIVLSHHENWDGSGYPRGLNGEEIPLESRLIAVSDAYDAMTSGRPYRMKMPHEQAIQEIQRLSGIQFDPHVVQAFMEAVRTGAFTFTNDNPSD